MQRSEQEPVRVRYDHEETGWATPIGDGLAVIDNIPLTDRCNLRDIVSLEGADEDGLPWVGRVLYRRYRDKSALYYYGPREFQTLSSALRALGCEAEGARAPVDFTPGVLLVAHDLHVRPDLLAVAAGIPQPPGVPSRAPIRGGSLVASPDELRLETLDGAEAASWRQEEWDADPALAAEILNTLVRCLRHGVDEAWKSLPKGGSGRAGRVPTRSGRTTIDSRPLAAPFRRWRRLGG
jgi:hypothetical protein